MMNNGGGDKVGLRASMTFDGKESGDRISVELPMNMKLPVHFAVIIFSGIALAGCNKTSSQRPAHCPQFDMSSFEPLDTNHDGFLSDSEFQVHRDEMHGPGVPKECHIPYDKGSYERLASKEGMSRDEFKVHLQEMEKRAAQGGSGSL